MRQKHTREIVLKNTHFPRLCCFTFVVLLKFRNERFFQSRHVDEVFFFLSKLNMISCFSVSMLFMTNQFVFIV